MLYNLTPAAGSMFGYKHSAESIIKMEERFKDKNNHPMFGKTHSIEAKELISKPGALNPMFGKIHTIETRKNCRIVKAHL
jgi:group I intron endonuclease